MGILDHRKTHRYRVDSSPADCVQAFMRAFGGGGGIVTKAHWRLTSSRSGATATYEGRKGLASFATGFSQRAQSEERGALGSKVTFEIEGSDDGVTACAMYLSGAATTFGLTHDARFFRPYMRAVERELQELDPAVVAGKT